MPGTPSSAGVSSGAASASTTLRPFRVNRSIHVYTTGTTIRVSNVEVSTRPLLESLAVLPTVSNAELYTGWVDESVTSGMLVAVVGAVVPTVARSASTIRRR